MSINAMHYKLVSRDNIESNILEVWPPVLDERFTLFNNHVIEMTFPSEEQIFNWLDSRSRTKYANKMTNTQKAKNGDPNKIYAVYYCDSEDPDFLPIYMYSIKMIRPGEPQFTYTGTNGERVKTSFKKYNIPKYDLLERIIPSALENDPEARTMIEGAVVHSSELREVHFKYFEGIYPISQDLGVDMREISGENQESSEDDDSGVPLPDKPYIRTITKNKPKPKPKILKMVQKTEKEIHYEDYMKYVSAIHKLDTEQQRFLYNTSGVSSEDKFEDERTFDVVFSDTTDKWLDHFLTKLEKVESYLRILATGGRGQFNLRYSGNSNAGGQHEIRRQNMIQEIKRVLQSNVDMTQETAEDFRKIDNLISDPLLFDGNVYQIRYANTLLTWHANYSEVLKDLRIIPSKQFSLFIIMFDFSDFFKQNQPIEYLTQIYESLMSVYQVQAPETRRVRYVKGKTSKVRKVTRRFWSIYSNIYYG
jgi:hypothetical protein